jgi:hypothetical protein
MNHLFRRVTKPEHNEVIVGRMAPMARFLAARDQAALRLTGQSFDSIKNDKALCERVCNDFGESYIPKLSDADLATLKAEFEGMCSDADLAAAKAEFAEMRSRARA